MTPNMVQLHIGVMGNPGPARLAAARDLIGATLTRIGLCWVGVDGATEGYLYWPADTQPEDMSGPPLVVAVSSAHLAEALSQVMDVREREDDDARIRRSVITADAIIRLLAAPA